MDGGGICTSFFCTQSFFSEKDQSEKVSRWGSHKNWIGGWNPC